jgi:hypothetical protein
MKMLFLVLLSIIPGLGFAANQNPAIVNWINLNSVCFYSDSGGIQQSRQECNDAVDVLSKISNDSLAIQASCRDANGVSDPCPPSSGVMLVVKALPTLQ